MKHIIIGTAGHIDHGKTTLIKALTGRNTDRWEEEQRRGITIDLGFTYFDLKNGDRAGIIDVPGHERFINNMVAGVVGMDMVLLVIAADEGIMPQTREHVDILGLLGIEKSIIVLNKCDLVDEEWLELVEEEVQEELKGTFLEEAPVMKVSAATGEGLSELVELIEDLAQGEVAEKDVHTIPRLPVDRVFSLHGFGTIITGTLTSGKITKDDVLEMYPLGKECKVRNIQVHDRDVKEACAGQRVAINISNLKKREIHRGCVIAPPNNMKNTKLLDVKLEVLKSSNRVVTNQMRLHFFSGTSEVLCRAVLLDRSEIGPGESGYVQLRLEEEIALRRGDRFIVRFYSPLETIGGGVVLEPNPERAKRFNQETLEGLKQKESGAPEDVIALHVKNQGMAMITQNELAKLTAMSVEEVAENVEMLKKQERVLVYPMKKEVYVWDCAAEADGRKQLKNGLLAHVQKYPYRYGMPKAEAGTRWFSKMKPAVFDQYVDELAAAGEISRRAEFLAPAQYEIQKDDVYNHVSATIIAEAENAGYDFIRISEMNDLRTPRETVDDILQSMMAEGFLVKVADDMYTTGKLMDEAKEKIIRQLKQEGKITIAQVRDMFSTSRKSAKPILEYMDSIKITKKTGAESERVSNL